VQSALKFLIFRLSRMPACCKATIAALLVAALDVWGLRRKQKHKETAKWDPDYDCNGDGTENCGTWDYAEAECANGNVCSYRYKFGDTLLDHSCRCIPGAKVPTEYDCDGDGTDDCKDWSYAMARCETEHICSYQYKFGDTVFDHSCRCQPKCMGENMKDCKPEITDYDCNADGVKECGQWDYPKAQCANLAICGYQYQAGDIVLDESCRCSQCARDSSPTSAGADKNLVPAPNADVAGSSGYWARWQTWADHQSTCAPWMMPTSDSDLRMLLAYAASRKYIVRPSGAGHSAGALVNDGEDERVMVVSLGAYVSGDSDWEFSLDSSAMKVKVNAGWSQLDVYERIRPKDLFFPTQTAGYFFQMAGIVANTVHGAGYTKSFVHAYVTSMRVMLHDGTIKIIEDESELKFWRNSYGLLGLILGVEIQVVKREKHQMYTKTREMPWTEENYWKFILEDAEAELPANISGGASSGGSQKSIAGEFFIDLLPNSPTFIVYANKENENADEEGYATGMPSNIAQNYQDLRNDKVEKFPHNGKIPYGESVRKEGCPPLYLDPFQIVNVNRLVGGRLVPTLARVINPVRFAAQTVAQLPDLVKTQRDRSNDGFFAVKAPNTLIAAYFIKPERSWEAMDFMRRAVIRRNGQADWLNAEGFSWNQPAEFRFMQVTDDAVLQPVPPGLWFVSEILSFPDSAATDQAWKEAIKEIEDYWTMELGAIPHIGKLFGFGETNGTLEVFHQSKVCRVYSDEQKAAFGAYRARMDPVGRFNYGLGEKLLRSC